MTGAQDGKEGLSVEIEGVGTEVFDQILVAVGRVPNGHAIDAAAAGVRVDERGFIAVDAQMRTGVPGIYAIGDIVGPPMLAHKATHEGKVAAEVIAGHDVEFDARAIPSVAYTDPEVAWMGLTETEAQTEGIEYEKAVFPWAASGRALALGRDDGLTKLLVEPESHRLLGAGIVGVGAGELIAETVHAIEMGANAQDIALTIHPHPTLSETVGFSAELADGTITDSDRASAHGGARRAEGRVGPAVQTVSAARNTGSGRGQVLRRLAGAEKLPRPDGLREVRPVLVGTRGKSGRPPVEGRWLGNFSASWELAGLGPRGRTGKSGRDLQARARCVRFCPRGGPK